MPFPRITEATPEIDPESISQCREEAKKMGVPAKSWYLQWTVSDGSIDARPGKSDVMAESEEIPRAEIIAESERHEAGDVPLFRTETVGADAASTLIDSGAGGKTAAPKSVMPPIPRHASDTSLQPARLPQNDFSRAAWEQPDSGFPEIQPPLAILAIGFLVLMFLLW